MNICKCITIDSPLESWQLFYFEFLIFYTNFYEIHDIRLEKFVFY